MQSMYQGKTSFDREQLVFVVEAALVGALDKVDGAMPQCESDKAIWDQTFNKAEREQYQHGAVSQVGIFVPILYAQLNQPDGMGTCDFVGWDEFEKMVEKFITDKWADPGIFHPNCRELAELIIDRNFGGPCPYCGGNCRNEPEDSQHLCDGFAGDIDGILDAEKIEECDHIYVVVCNIETIENGEGTTEAVVLDHCGYFFDASKAEEKSNQLNKTHGKENVDTFYEEYGVEPFGYIPLKKSGPSIKERLEYLRSQLEAECISYDELHELQSLAKHIEPGDVQLLEAAGVPE